MKEKIGMEKLIALLNEFEGFKEDEFESWRLDEYGYLTEGGDYMRIGTNAKIISKQFGFIKWLVENDKIDRAKVKEKIGLEGELYNRMLYWYKEDDFLIMILSVENEPIRFLCEILK